MQNLFLFSKFLEGRRLSGVVSVIPTLFIPGATEPQIGYTRINLESKNILKLSLTTFLQNLYFVTLT